MGLPNEVVTALIGAANQGGYEIEQSLRFDGNGYLSRTPGSNGNLRTNTISVWIKQSVKDAPQSLFGQGRCGPRWSVSSRVGEILHNAGVGGTNNFLYSDGRYRDPSAWYHLVIIHDTTQATESDRVRIYVNGTEITFSSASYPGQNADMNFNNTETLTIGRGNVSDTEVWLGYMAEYQFIDGTAVEPTSFAEYNNQGVWVPKAYAGSYGTQGYYLKFDSTATNGIGHDHSGNGNNFTATGFTTSGTGTDVMSDTPTNNWCTLNPLHTESSFTYSNGNLEVQQSTGSGSAATSGGTIAVSSGKWFCEMSAIDKNATNALIGVCTVDGFDGNRQLNESLTGGSGYGYVTNGNTATGSAYGSTWDLYDNMGIALDLDSAQNTVTFYKNGVSQGARNIDNAAYVFACSNGQGSSYVTYRTNFGQRDFLMTPGTTTGTDYFNAVTWTGNGSTQSITGVGFQPDLVWIKSTTNSYDHYIADSIRGAYAFLISNNTGSQNSTANYDPMSSFDSDGFSVRYTLTGGSTNDQTNTSGASYIAWCWKAGGSSSSNTDGSITSTVSASTAGAFSVCTYTGNSTSGATFGHGLDDAPGFVIVKNRDSGVQPWRIFHSSLGNTKAFKFDSNSADTDSAYWNNTSPSSTVVTLGNDNSTNATGDAYVAYCWAEKAGVTKIGTYTGNETLGGGPEVVCGFRPACVVMKADAGAAWEIHDFKRDANSYLTWSSNSTPTARQANKVLLTDNGFIIMGNDGNINLNGATIYFIAFAADHTTDTTYEALNTANLSAPSIKDGGKYFNTVLYTGDGTSSRAITGMGFQPDFLWLKPRSTRNHSLVDVLRGTNHLKSNTTDAEVSVPSFDSFDSDGFTVTSDGSTNPNWNENPEPNVVWGWLAGGSGSSNTDGTITSTVSASAESGFSIVTYSGNNSSSATVGHGLGVTPDLVIIKDRSTSNYVWMVKFGVLNGDILELPGTRSKSATSSYSTGTVGALTSTTFGFATGSGLQAVNNTGQNYLAYCFVSIDGYSKIGSYEGNASSDGPFVYCGFKPAMVFYKNADATSDWTIVDSARSPYNEVDLILDPNATTAEASFGTTNRNIDFLSNGFKIRSTASGGTTALNASGNTIVFAAWAENPFGGSGVSPATAR